MSRSTSSDRPSRRRWLKGAAAGLVPLSLGGALALPPAREALARAFEGSPALGALSLGGPWLGGPALDPDALEGRVALVCFWTYSCINSLRVLPYLRAWRTRYGARGLTVIGVHTPEFAFETEVANVRQAVKDLDVTFPVVMDSDRRIWRAFGNDAWPAFYVIGADGRLRGHVDGEGRYDQIERLIRKLLSHGPSPGAPEGLSAVNGVGPQAPPDWRDLASAETYVGYAQAADFVSPGGLRRDVEQTYHPPRDLPMNRWSLSGGWLAGEEFATSAAPNAAIAHRFHARDLHMVLAPAMPGRPVRARVRLGGLAPGADHGWDVGADGLALVDRPRMYQLVRQAGAVDDRTFELQALDPGLRAYVFTFG